MSETLKWAHDLRDGRLNRHTLVSQMHLLAEAMIADADTSPASQERDEDGLLERATERAACDPRHAEQHATATLLRIQRILEQPKGSIGKRKILRQCRGAIVGLLARLRSGSEPGEHGWSVDHPKGSIADLTEDEAHTHAQLLDANGRGPAFVIRPDGTEDAEHFAPAARPSGGEGAPEPDGTLAREHVATLFRWDTNERGREWTVRETLHRLDEEIAKLPPGKYPLFMRLPPEREAEAREPDAMTYAKDPRRDLAEWSEVLAVRRFDPEKCKTDGSGPPWPVFFGTPGPDREAEIRADERRAIREKIRTSVVAVAREIQNMDATGWDEELDEDNIRLAERAVDYILSRLSPEEPDHG